MRTLIKVLAGLSLIGSIFLYLIYGASLERMIQIGMSIILLVLTTEDR
ncbi:MAG: hypothetical protein ACRCR2_08080 [Fusobacteriaceae bacterium]